MDLREFGAYIAQLRKAKKVSQEQLSRDLGISRATISSLENGTSSDVGIKKILHILEQSQLLLGRKLVRHSPAWSS